MRQKIKDEKEKQKQEAKEQKEKDRLEKKRKRDEEKAEKDRAKQEEKVLIIVSLVLYFIDFLRLQLKRIMPNKRKGN